MNDVDTFEVEDGRPDGWFRIDHALLTEYGADLGPYGIAVYAALAHHVNARKECWPSYNRIVALTGISRVKVIHTIEKLEQMGLIRRKVRATPDSEFANLPNVYVLLPLVDIIPRKRDPKQGGVNDVNSPVQDGNPPVHVSNSGSSPRKPKQESINKNQEQESSAPASDDLFNAPKVTLVNNNPVTASYPPGTNIKLRRDLPPVRPMPKASDDPAIAALLDELRPVYPFRGGKVAKPILAKRALAGLSLPERDQIKVAARNYAASSDGQEGYAKDLHTWIETEEWREYLTPAKARPGKVAPHTGPAPRPYTVITKGA